MSPALSNRIGRLEAQSLSSGSHDADSNAICVMEAAAYVAGEPWSDHPACVCPIIAAFLRSWNDSLLTDADRDRLLKPIILEVLDTRATSNVEQRRGFMALDWLIRVFTPKWLDLVPKLKPHADALRNLDEIADLTGATAAGKLTAATRAAARAAAWDAAWDAAGDFLKPTTEWLQLSAVDLVKRMAKVQP